MLIAPRFFAAVALLIVCSQSLFAAASQDAEAARAKKLLSSAVEYYHEQGDAAFAAFSRQGEFIDGEHYVFVVDTKGTMLASGGTSAVLIGRDVSNVLEPELREAFKHALASQDQGIQVGEYRWTNARDSRVERKQVYYQRVGDRIIAVGLYLPRASAQQAQDLLGRAVTELQKDPQAAIAAINDLSPKFREDDLYVFVIDSKTQGYVAHGYNPRLLGVDFATVRDPSGQPVGAPILALMRKAEKGDYQYRWKNPVTGKIENKHALVQRAGPYIVAVGYYDSPR